MLTTRFDTTRAQRESELERHARHPPANVWEPEPRGACVIDNLYDGLLRPMGLVPYDLNAVCFTCSMPIAGRARRCARCFSISYCSSKCQPADWSVHRSECVERDSAFFLKPIIHDWPVYMTRRDSNRGFYVPGFATNPSSEHLAALKPRFLPRGNPSNHPLFLLDHTLFDSIIQCLTPKSILVSLITSRCWLQNVVRYLRRAFVTCTALGEISCFGGLATDDDYNTYRSLLSPSNAGHRFLEFSCGKNHDGSEYRGCKEKTFAEILNSVVRLKMDSNTPLEWNTALLLAARDTGPINIVFIDSLDSRAAKEIGGDFTVTAFVIVIPFKKKSRYIMYMSYSDCNFV